MTVTTAVNFGSKFQTEDWGFKQNTKSSKTFSPSKELRNFVIEGVAYQPPLETASHSSITNFLKSRIGFWIKHKKKFTNFEQIFTLNSLIKAVARCIHVQENLSLRQLFFFNEFLLIFENLLPFTSKLQASNFQVKLWQVLKN